MLAAEQGDAVLALTHAIRSLEARALFGRRRFSLRTTSDNDGIDRRNSDVVLTTLIDDVRVLSRVQSPNTIDIVTVDHHSSSSSSTNDNVLRRVITISRGVCVVIELRCELSKSNDTEVSILFCFVLS